MYEILGLLIISVITFWVGGKNSPWGKNSQGGGGGCENLLSERKVRH